MRTSILLLFLPALAWAQGTTADYERISALRTKYKDSVFRDNVETTWLKDGGRFWYKVRTGPKESETYMVDAATGKKEKLKEPPKDEAVPNTVPTKKGFRQKRDNTPEGNHRAFIEGFNLWIENKETKEKTQLTKDGTVKDAYTDSMYWSPDRSKLVVLKVEPGQEHKVTMVESSPKDQVQPKLKAIDYLKPGDKLPIWKVKLFDIAGKKEIPVDNALFKNPYERRAMFWSPKGDRFLFEYNQRGHTAYRVLALDATTGEVKPIVNEEPKTFFDYAGKYYCRYLEGGEELIWMSERSGWNHLYLIDMQTAQVKNPITKGEWVVRTVERMDEKNRVLWFWAGGVRPGQDPYFLHLCRVNFDGTGFTILTEADGNHRLVSASPDWKRIVVSHSTVNHAPVTELRNGEDGKLVAVLETADDSKLRVAGWQAPEPFVAKGRDGKTDIYGVIQRPSNFDPSKKYPVIENIYAGPHSAFAPKSFRVGGQLADYAELGFIVVKMDGMGTSQRSKEFHDVCWKNLGDAGFPDRIAWMKAAAAKYPYMDITRVGVWGGSAGGQNAMRALIAHNDFYKVAVADCGCHDNRMDKIWWNELWMSWPVGDQYKEASNVDQAHRMKGKLLLTVGELDTNVDPASTMQVVNALIKADKDFDFAIVPGANHGAGESPYMNRRRMDFFVRHLHGVEPRSK